MSALLPIRKLRTTEDEFLHKALGKLDRADPYARDIVLAGEAVPHVSEAFARIAEALDALAGRVPRHTREDDDDPVILAYQERVDYAYLLGIAVGLRLAKIDGGAR